MTLMVIGFLVGFGFGLIKAYKQFKGLQRAVMMVFASLVMGMVGVVAGIILTSTIIFFSPRTNEVIGRVPVGSAPHQETGDSFVVATGQCGGAQAYYFSKLDDYSREVGLISLGALTTKVIDDRDVVKPELLVIRSRPVDWLRKLLLVSDHFDSVHYEVHVNGRPVYREFFVQPLGKP